MTWGGASFAVSRLEVLISCGGKGLSCFMHEGLRGAPLGTPWATGSLPLHAPFASSPVGKEMVGVRLPRGLVIHCPGPRPPLSGKSGNFQKLSSSVKWSLQDLSWGTGVGGWAGGDLMSSVCRCLAQGWAWVAGVPSGSTLPPPPPRGLCKRLPAQKPAAPPTSRLHVLQTCLVPSLKRPRTPPLGSAAHTSAGKRGEWKPRARCSLRVFSLTPVLGTVFL